VETATGVDVAGKIVEFIEKNAQPGKTKTRGRRLKWRGRHRER
jgi:ribosomal protein S6--L-glutamate ligase